MCSTTATVNPFEEFGPMHARTATLFDSSRSALLLRADPGSDTIPSHSPALPSNTMRANDLPRDTRLGPRASTVATYGFDREPSPWKP